MTEEQVLGGLIEREGGFVVNPDDRGGPTKYGITAATLGNWLGLNRPASKQEVYELTETMARQIYRVKYIQQPGFTKENIPFEPLRVQLIDFGVNSGPERAVRWLQRILGMPREEHDGIIGPETRRALSWAADDVVPSKTLLRYSLINDALVAARLYMIDSWTDADPSQKKFEEGVESRALGFFLAKP